MKVFSIVFVFCLSLTVAFGQQDTSAYTPLEFYLPSFNPPQGNPFRSADGTPGPDYWQNSASYVIHATLDDKVSSVSGDVTIHYTNNSPDPLDFLWLQLDQNLFRQDSRGSAATPVTGDRFDSEGFAQGGYHITNVTVTYHGKSTTVQPVISDTRMQVRLDTPMQPKGDQIDVKVDYDFIVPIYGSDRMGRTETKNGIIYEIAQWYPRMCVYDDIEGWCTLPYMGLGEFYCEYGDYDYYITAPSDMFVYGSGDLQNPTDVLTAEEVRRLDQAGKSDQTVPIIKAEEIGKKEMRPTTKGTLTWHFTMKNSRDVAWAASKALIWDAARVNLPSGRKALAMSAYPVEAVGDTAWSRATEYLKNSIEIYSNYLFEYPWNNAVNIGGRVGGMEYPGMIFCSYHETKAELWDLITHEIGHNWFPMLVGSNERRNMWQDEGFNTYINDYATDLFNHGEYAGDTILRKEYFSEDLEALPHRKFPLMTLPEAMAMDEFDEYYNRTSVGLKLLRDVVLGHDRFDYAFKEYTHAWAFKHPTPYDFFHLMNNAAGEDLNWFWKEWFFTTWTLDQAVTNVSYINSKPSKGGLITIQNVGKQIMPVMVKVVQKDGKVVMKNLPVEIWQRGATWTFPVPTTGPISQVILDPGNQLPDIQRSNNVWSER